MFDTTDEFFLSFWLLSREISPARSVPEISLYVRYLSGVLNINSQVYVRKKTNNIYWTWKQNNGKTNTYGQRSVYAAHKVANSTYVGSINAIAVQFFFFFYNIVSDKPQIRKSTSLQATGKLCSGLYNCKHVPMDGRTLHTHTASH